ncbi:MAG: NifB/NifX family molybdenum-iron cluster-binding protein, partial [Anaerolineales bacterium]
AQQYAVITIQNGEVAGRELRPKFSPHAEGADQQHASGSVKHHRMVDPILDCQVLVARGIGQGAHGHLIEADIQPLLTGVKLIEEAVSMYLAGELEHEENRMHAHGRQHHHDHNHDHE